MTTTISTGEGFVEFHFDSDSDAAMLPDGDWRFMLAASHIRDGDINPRARVANTLTDLVGLVALDYDTIDTDDDLAFHSRYYAAREIAGEVQAVYNAQAAEASIDMTEPALDVVWQDKNVAVVGLGEWDEAVPLVLVRTDYTPITNNPAPTGSIVWIDPSTEQTFIESCAVAGFVEFGNNQD